MFCLEPASPSQRSSGGPQHFNTLCVLNSRSSEAPGRIWIRQETQFRIEPALSFVERLQLLPAPAKTGGCIRDHDNLLQRGRDFFAGRKPNRVRRMRAGLSVAEERIERIVSGAVR